VRASAPQEIPCSRDFWLRPAVRRPLSSTWDHPVITNQYSTSPIIACLNHVVCDGHKIQQEMQQMPFHASSGTLAQGIGGPSLNDLVAQSSAFFNFNAGNLLPLHSQLQGGSGNITLGGSSGLPPNVPFPNGVSLFGPSFGQMFPDLNALDTRTTGSVDESLLEMSGQQAGPSRSGGDGGSLSGRTGSAYASRHQAAEQRRRTRINER